MCGGGYAIGLPNHRTDYRPRPTSRVRSRNARVEGADAAVDRVEPRGEAVEAGADRVGVLLTEARDDLVRARGCRVDAGPHGGRDLAAQRRDRRVDGRGLPELELVQAGLQLLAQA